MSPPGAQYTAEAIVALGTTLLEQGRLEESTRLFLQAIHDRPNDLELCLQLGYLLHVRGALDEAAVLYYRVLEVFPESDEVCSRLGNVERSRGNLEQAIGLLRRAFRLRPGFWEARNNLGLTLEEAGESGAAARELAEALEVAPDRAEVHYNLAISLTSLGRLDEAAAAYRRSIELNPGAAEAHNNLGAALKALGRLDEAVTALQAALRIQPNWAAAQSNLAGVYEWQARHDDALACHRRAIVLAPADAGAHGSYLYALLFHPRYDSDALRTEHREWNRRHAEPLRRFSLPYPHDRTPERRLRIGYVGGFFRDHVVGRNLIPLLREHDRTRVEVICYSSNPANDETTNWFRQESGGWREIARMSDAESAALIREDRIDILVDTSLHMDSRRLLVFARKPAPVQVTFAGYPGSTGMTAIDYRLTDAYLEPYGNDEGSAETPWRLPQTFWCYDPLGTDPSPGDLPAEAAGRVTFGCLNNFSKVNDRVLELWAQVLGEVEDSRLLVLCHEGSHRASTLEVLRWHGVEPARVEFARYRPRRRYLELFRRIDVSLDTHPYNGHTTSLDSLWMGVPVVTLVGDTVAARAGLSQLMNLQLGELIAHTPQEYVAIAAGLATDRGRLKALRGTLRARMERSPLMDAKAFARGIEQAYREMWRRWCAATPAVTEL